jgi:hypothetical protein
MLILCVAKKTASLSQRSEIGYNRIILDVRILPVLLKFTK